MSRWLPRLTALALIATSAIIAPVFARTLQLIPTVTARVTDMTGTLTAGQQSMLEEKLAAFEARRAVRVAVLMVPTTKPEHISLYSSRAVAQWKRERRNIDSGTLLVVAKDDHELHIDGALTDLTAQSIISETIAPSFRQGDFFGGINAGLDQVIRVIDDQPLPAPDVGWQGKSRSSRHSLWNEAAWIILVGLMYGSGLREFFSAGVAALIGSAAAGAAVYFVGSYVGKPLSLAIAAGMIVFLLSLILGGPREVGRSHSGRQAWWGATFGSAFWGPRVFGTDETGGFGGRSRDFKGGGASGRW
jgi:uncharacterized protein